ncbi:MAG: hypothetical protein JJU36_16460 [Phycisphaeraceae bacterium]|nr:hypothetical protein [Phycisphaeraceae bacterium]
MNHDSRLALILLVAVFCVVSGCRRDVLPPDPTTEEPPALPFSVYLADRTPRPSGYVVEGPAGQKLYLPDEPALTRADLESARAVAVGVFGDPGMVLTLRPESAQRFANLTTEHVGKPIAVMMNGQVVQIWTLTQPMRQPLTVSRREWTRQEVLRIIEEELGL